MLNGCEFLKVWYIYSVSTCEQHCAGNNGGVNASRARRAEAARLHPRPAQRNVITRHRHTPWLFLFWDAIHLHFNTSMFTNVREVKSRLPSSRKLHASSLLSAIVQSFIKYLKIEYDNESYI